MPSTKTLRVTLQDIVGATGGSGSTATVFARYVDTAGRGRDIHLDDGTIVVPVRRTVTPDADPEWWDFTVIPSDAADVREEDQGFLVEVAWVVTAPEGGKTSGAERVLVPSTADAIVQLGSLYTPGAIPAVTAQRIISGGTAADPLYDIRIRHDDSAGWAAEDPVLSLGEQGIDTDTGVVKIGDGVTAWSALPVASIVGEFGTAATADATDFATAAQGATADTAAQKAANLSDLANAGAARTNLGLGTAATTAATAYAPAAAASVTGATGLQAQEGRGRFVGVTAGGPPSSGAYQSGDWTVDQAGSTWVCLQPGTPGTWMRPGADVFTPKTLTWGDGNNTDWREVPGTLTTPGLMTKDRVYAMAFPIPTGKTITNVSVNVTTVGEAGSVLRAGVYTDDRGWPKALISDLGTVAATSTGFKQFTAATPISGGRFVWVVLVAQNCPTTAPATSRFTSTPWHPVSSASTGADYSTGSIACYSNTVSGALPTAWPQSRTSQMTQPTSPFFVVRYGLDTPQTLYVPDRAPALWATEAWEQGCVMEPNVYWDGTRWVMLYSGGWATERLGWATAPTIDGPWTKHGQLVPGSSGRSSVFFDAGTMYVYYDNKVVSGPDIEHLGAPSTTITLDATITNVVNTSTIKDGSTYRMIFEGKGPAGGVYWKMGYASATSPLGPFTPTTFPLTGFPTLAFSGPHLTKVGANFELWWHGGTGNLPTDIYHATSADCVTWTAESTPRIVRTAVQEVDQCADPYYVSDPSTGTGYLFWSAMDNVTPAAAIMRSLPQSMTIAP